MADGENVNLVCAGLDTVATVAVNGTPIARTANMHRQYRFPVTSLLRPGANTVEVRCDSAHRYAEQLRDRMGPRPNAYPEPFDFIRKMACDFGWAWGPNVVTAAEHRAPVQPAGAAVRERRPGLMVYRLGAAVLPRGTRWATQSSVGSGRWPPITVSRSRAARAP